MEQPRERVRHGGQAHEQASQSSTSQRTLWDDIWRDRQGRIVIWQFPNAWLIGWAVLTMASLLTGKLAADILSWLASASLVIWSLLEIFKGANHFRRALGLVVLACAVAMIINYF